MQSQVSCYYNLINLDSVSIFDDGNSTWTELKMGRGGSYLRPCVKKIRRSLEPGNDIATNLFLSSSPVSPYCLHSLSVKIFFPYHAGGKIEASLGFYYCSLIVNPVDCSSQFHYFLPLPRRIPILLMYSHGYSLHQVHVIPENLTPSPFGSGVGQGPHWCKPVVITLHPLSILLSGCQTPDYPWMLPNWLLVKHLT